MDHWEEIRVLILGKTYPNYSKKYGETACTGGIRADTLEMVRLYPVPERYLDSDSVFSAFQWIRVRVKKDLGDPRPESLRIDFRSIVAEEKIPAKDVKERLHWVRNCKHMVGSVEELHEHQKAHGTSLGIVVPSEITGFAIRQKPQSKRQEWELKEREILGQGFLFEASLKPIDFPSREFQVSWKCAHTACKGHTMNLLQWGIHQLYRKYPDPAVAEEKVKEAMKRELDLDKREVFLFLGNFRGVLYNFGLMDSYSPIKEKQLGLF